MNMKILIHIIGIISGIYCLYYQIIVYIFTNYSRTTQVDFIHIWESDKIPQILTLIILILFTIYNSKIVYNHLINFFKPAKNAV